MTSRKFIPIKVKVFLPAMLLASVFWHAKASAATVIQISGGARSCIALESDGTVWDWGFNWFGKLGDNTVSTFSPPDFSNDRHAPIQVHGPGNVGYLQSMTAILACESANMAIKSDGTVWAWGSNALFGQCGDGTNIDRYTPVQVSGLTSVTALGGRGYHCLALKSDGSVWAWGYNGAWELGEGTTVTASNVPVHVNGLTSASAITGGYVSSIALLPDTTLRSWGGNSNGQLGNGSFASSGVPVTVVGLSSVAQVSCGWKHALAVKTDGTVWGWGLNFNGEVGDGTTSDSSVPLQVPGLANVTMVSGGDSHSAALKSDGTVWTWGANDKGQLGDGTYVEEHSPVQVNGLTSVTAIAARDYHNLAIRSDNTVWAWGWNINGQLGDNSTTTATLPVQVQFPAVTPVGISGISAW